MAGSTSVIAITTGGIPTIITTGIPGSIGIIITRLSITHLSRTTGTGLTMVTTGLGEIHRSPVIF